MPELLIRDRVFTLMPAPTTPIADLGGSELLATVRDDRGWKAGTVTRNNWGWLRLVRPNGTNARVSDVEHAALVAVFEPRRVSDLPTWDEMCELDRGAALMHVWKRKWETIRYAIEHYPAQYLADSRLAALDERLACWHARVVAGSWDEVCDRLGMDEVERLYYLALGEEETRRDRGKVDVS